MGPCRETQLDSTVRQPERDGATGMTVFASSEDSTVANRPSLLVAHGDQPGEMGASLPALDLGN